MDIVHVYVHVYVHLYVYVHMSVYMHIANVYIRRSVLLQPRSVAGLPRCISHQNSRECYRHSHGRF